MNASKNISLTILIFVLLANFAQAYRPTVSVPDSTDGLQAIGLNVAGYAWGQEHNGLRIGISQVKPPKQNDSDKPQFRVALQNTGKKDLVLNLGMMLANGKEQYSTAVKLIFTDANSNTYEFHNNIGRHPGIAGRLDPFVVPLAVGCSYVLSVNFDNHWFIPIGTSLPKGQYRVTAVFKGKGVVHTNLDMEGISLMPYWTGEIKSKKLLFKNPCGDRIFQKPNSVTSEKVEGQHGLRNHTNWISECIKRIQSIKPGATRDKLLKVCTTEGGISTRSWRRYVYRECPYIKVDVKFKPIDNDKQEKPGDVITEVSKPFLEWSIMD